MALGDVIARLAVSLALETAAFEKGATLAEKRMAQTQRKFAKLGDKIGSIGQKMSLGLTAPLAAFGVSAFNAASDAAELQSAFNETFGDMADDMTEWAQATGDAMGRSTQSMQEMANTFGIFFNQAAPTRKEAAEMSKTFAVLAQDLASFYNVSESDALQKLRSGLSGESEPLRDFGVFLSEATVKAKGLEMGLGGLSGELTEQEKIMARYQLILESTTNAQGDVARTSDGTANQMRKAKAAFEELQVVVGTKLLPAITPLIDRLASLIDWFAKLPDPVQEGVVVVGGIVAALGPLLMVVGQLTSAIPLLTKALTFLFAHPIILGAAAVITGIVLAWMYWDEIEAIVRRVYNAVKAWILDKMGAVWDFTKRAVIAYFKLYTTLPVMAIKAVADLYRGVKTWLQDKLGAVFDTVRKKVEMVEGAFHWLWDKVVGNSWVPDMVDGIAAEMARLDKVMVDPAAKAARKTSEIMRDMATEVRQLLDRLFPEIGVANRYRNDLALLEGSGLGASAKAEARRRLALESVGIDHSAPVDIKTRGGPLDGGIDKSLEDFSRTMDKWAKRSGEATVRVAKSFKDMATDTISALRRMTDAIRGGGFLDILEGIFGLGMQLGSIGVFGQKIADNINSSVPGYATGTRSAAPGLAWVGERGPELVNFRGGERVWSNRESMAMGGGIMEIRPSPLFDVYVDGKLVQAAPAMMQGGAQLAGSEASFAQSRRIGG